MSRESIRTALREFLHNIDTQDTLATAKPVIIELQEKVRIYLGDDICATGSARAKDCDLGDSPEDLGMDPDEILYWRDEWRGRQWFFTMAGYQEHLKLNRHNYKEIRAFIHHAFRNPEIKQVFEWLRELDKLLGEKEDHDVITT